MFVTGGAKPDVRIFVFDQEFHVSSGALKLHSAFFRKFLEPSGGIQPSSSAPSVFKSDWYTQIDTDLPTGWGLCSDAKVSRSLCEAKRAYFDLPSSVAMPTTPPSRSPSSRYLCSMHFSVRSSAGHLKYTIGMSFLLLHTWPNTTALCQWFHLVSKDSYSESQNY